MLSEINDVSVIMPTALVGTVLLTLRGRGVGKTELIRRVEWLSERVRAQGGRVAHFANAPTNDVVHRALEVLGPGLVGLVPGLPEETFYAVDRWVVIPLPCLSVVVLILYRFQLSFYRNMTIHLFILQALVSAALYTKVKLGGGPEMQRISYNDLHDQVHFLSQLFRGEFIFPTEGLDHNLNKTIAGLESDNVIEVTRESESSTRIMYISLSSVERASGRENFDFYCFLIWPFVEAAWLGSISLMMLAPPPAHSSTSIWLDYRRFQDRAQLLGKTLYHQGDLSYFEAVNKETLKNAYIRFEEDGIILVTKSKNAKTSPPKVRLAEEWMPKRDGQKGDLIAHGPLWAFSEKISLSRREGKNRRDGATVQGRVLGLANSVGMELWDEVGVAKELEGEGEREALATAKMRKKKGRNLISVAPKL